MAGPVGCKDVKKAGDGAWRRDRSWCMEERQLGDRGWALGKSKHVGKHDSAESAAVVVNLMS